MKSEQEVIKRMRKIRFGYAKKHALVAHVRAHRNCQYNKLHVPDVKLIRKYNQNTEEIIAPKKSVSLVIVNDERSIHLCMYGSDDCTEWSGDICDDDAIARSCKLFKPKVPANDLKNEFIGRLEDDQYVFEHYVDLATLQWVLDDRAYNHKFGWWEIIYLWFLYRILKVKKPTRSFDYRDTSDDEDLKKLWK